MLQLNMKRYKMDLSGKGMQGALVAMGLSFFLRMVYYFACVRIETVGVWELLSWMILPILLEGGFIVMIRILRLNLPGIYALMAAAMGLLMIFQSFGYGSLLRTILSIVAYLGCSVLIIGVAGGFLSKQIAVAAYLATALVRFFGFELFQMLFRFRVTALIKDLTGLLALIGLMYLAKSFESVEKKEKDKETMSQE